MKLGEKITILRKARGYSQEQLGLSLATKDNGVSRQTVSDWENGKSEPKLDNIRALADLLNVSFDALLDEDLDLNNQEYLNEVLNNSNTSSVTVLSDSNYYLYKRKYGLIYILIFLLIIGVSIGLMIPGFSEAKKYFAEAAGKNGDATMMGQNFYNRAITWQTVGILGVAIITIGAPISLFFFIKDILSKKSCGVLNKEEIIIYPQFNSKNGTIRIPLSEIKEIKKDHLFGINIYTNEKIHFANVKHRKQLIQTFTAYKR